MDPPASARGWRDKPQRSSSSRSPPPSVAPLRFSGDTVASGETKGDGSLGAQIHEISALIRKRKSELRTLKAGSRLARCEAKYLEVQHGLPTVRSLRERLNVARNVLNEATVYRGKCLKHLEMLNSAIEGKITAEKKSRNEAQIVLFDVRAAEQRNRMWQKRNSNIKMEVRKLRGKLEVNGAKLRGQVEPSHLTIELSDGTPPLTRQEKSLIRSSMPLIWQRMKRLDKNLRIAPVLVQRRFLDFLQKHKSEWKGQKHILQADLQTVDATLTDLKRQDKTELMTQSESKFDLLQSIQSSAEAKKIKYIWITRKLAETREAMVGLESVITSAMKDKGRELDLGGPSELAPGSPRESNTPLSDFRDMPMLIERLRRAVNALIMAADV